MNASTSSASPFHSPIALDNQLVRGVLGRLSEADAATGSAALAQLLA